VCRTDTDALSSRTQRSGVKHLASTAMHHLRCGLFTNVMGGSGDSSLIAQDDRGTSLSDESGIIPK